MPDTDQEKSGHDIPREEVQPNTSQELAEGTSTEHLNDARDEEAGGKDDVPTEQDEFEVTWDGNDDPTNPMNWSTWRKASIIAMVSFVTFLT